MADLIYTRNRNNVPLSMERIEHLAPAVFADTQADHLSDRYGQVTTAKAIEILGDFGYQPMQAAQVKSRKSDKVAHAPHLLAFAIPGADTVAGSAPEIALYNSHDGTSSLKLFAGVYRMVCSNGIIAGDGFDAKLRHTSTTVSGFEDLIRETADKLPEFMGRIDRMAGREIDGQTAMDFAYNAALQRWELPPEERDDRKGKYISKNTARSMLRSRRYEDQGADAWTVYNRVQEAMVRGGVQLVSYTDRYRGHKLAQPIAKTGRSRAIGSIKTVLDTNRQLWNLADEMGLAA